MTTVINCRYCGAEVNEEEPHGFWVTGEDSADARRHCTDAPDLLHDVNLPWILVNSGGTCEFCGEDVTGRIPQDACPANQDGDTTHSTVGWDWGQG